jgi:hypothetical protein
MSPLTGRWDAVPEAAPWGPCTRAARCAEGATVHSVTTLSAQRSSVQFARSQQVPRPPSSPPRSCKPAQSPRKAVEIAAVCSKTLTAMGRRVSRHRRQPCFFISQLQPRRDLCTRTQWCACCDSRARDSRSQRRHRGCPVPCFSACRRVEFITAVLIAMDQR